jgi:hypothetical protein
MNFFIFLFFVEKKKESIIILFSLFKMNKYFSDILLKKLK